jgi:hypothetical protein
MAGVFAFAALLQLNDPDPVRWIALYGSASLIAALACVNIRIPIAIICGLGLVALVWCVRLEAMVGREVSADELFQSWQMKDQTVELAREVRGLFIVTVWMAVTAARMAILSRRNRVR